MKVITWNVRCQNSGDDARGCGWAVRVEPLRVILSEQAPDVIATQEGFAPQIADLCAALPAYQMAGVGREDGDSAGEFCAIFFRTECYELRAQSTRWLSPTPDVPSFGWGAGYVRIVTKVRLLDRETKREFEVWNTHLDNASALARLESACQIRRAVEQSDVPVIVCGDFNSAPDDEPLLALTGNGGLRDSRLHSAQQPSGPHATYCGFAALEGRMDAPIRGEEARIDYVLTDKNWRIGTYAVVPTDDNASPISDHRPVVVELSL